jgi:hypothetical protein
MNTRLDARCGGSLHRSEAAQLARSFGLWELSDAASASNPIDIGAKTAQRTSYISAADLSSARLSSVQSRASYPWL